MFEVVSLTEHTERTLALTPAQARDLVAVARGRVDIRPAPEAGRYVVRATQYVGSVVVAGLHLAIRPKVPLANLFYMLAVPGPPVAWQDEDFAYGTERQLLPAFAALFARATDRALGRGALRAYRAEEARVPALRGRVDFAAHVRQPAVELPVACRFQEYTSDVVENRALRAAVRRCLRLGGLPERVRGTLTHQLARLEDVGDDPVSPDEIDRLHFTRLNRHYEPALRLAAIVLRAATLLDRAGGTAASAFLVDMNQVFEAFVTDRLRWALRGRLVVRDQVPTSLDVAGRVGMRPDLVFEHAGGVAFVADTKYKLADDALGRVADYYQLLAYTTALALPDGLLIYCHPGAGAPPTRVRVRHGGQALWAHAVPVAGSRAGLERAMVELADLVARLARASRH
jgi:5-methylcytosine-specific restriction enzyme subunit McrC